METRVAFVGLGAMGMPMAGHLAQAGLLSAVWNRSLAKAQQAAMQFKARAPEKLTDIAPIANVIVLCVSADSDVLSIVEALAPVLQRGSVIVDHSTVSSVTARTAQNIARKHGSDFIDAPVSGGVEGAKNGELSVMVGGASESLERVRSVLECYAAKLTHMGDIGAGQNTKAVNQVLVAGIAQAVCEGLALGEKLGLDPAALLPTLGAGAAGNWFLEKRGATMLRDEFSVGFKLALLHKDLSIVRGLAEQAGVSQRVIEQSIDDYAKLMALGHGDDDISALIRLKRDAAA